jgi:seryl-tRNA synthetase
MIDPKILRKNPELISQAIQKKKFECDLQAILELDQKRRLILQEVEQLRAKQKATNNEMIKLRANKEKFQEKRLEMRQYSNKLKKLQTQQQEIEITWEKAYLSVPNIPHPSVPEGKNEKDNLTIKTWGEKNNQFPHAKPHYEIPWFNELVNLERGVKVTGAGFPFFVGDMARLLRALIQFCLEELSAAGYIEFMPPILVNANSATATGQLPDKENQMYYIDQDNLYLIPTAEVPVTNFYRNHIFNAQDLPISHIAYTPCFRREAGSYGKDVRGLNRLHQFDKVEMVKWVHPEESFNELEKLREDAECLLQKLQLPYRVLLICTGDIGFPHAKQYDLEVWAAGQKRWLEVSSCSNFTDFQARRANIRFRQKNTKPQIVHTLNGSGLGLPRTLAAIIENNLQEDGRIKVPTALQPWMKKDFISGK